MTLKLVKTLNSEKGMHIYIHVQFNTFQQHKLPGSGISHNSGASGGSYGGRGGIGSGTRAGYPYGDINPLEDTTWGSGGGSSNSVNGGRGGGKLILEVANNFTMSSTGRIYSNGENSKVSIEQTYICKFCWHRNLSSIIAAQIKCRKLSKQSVWCLGVHYSIIWFSCNL